MKKIIQVPYIDQTKEYPTGCESVSTVMLLKYLGIDITVDEFIEKYLDKEPMRQIDGRLYGPNPWINFAGSPYDTESFGCYAPVIERALNKVFLAHKMDKKAKDITKMEMSEILERYIDKDMPVVFWASIDLKETIVGPNWYLSDGSVFTWISNEHCMLLVGYDQESYYFNDPWHNHGCIAYPRKLVEQRHKEQREMAVAVDVFR
ncbi:MAG: C39 family peptidase [Lachnospiraceae bacterium]|nr:C39 family peptidase [Lachnospiraceae bacterium]